MQEDMFRIVASVLNLGNTGFSESEGKARIIKEEGVEAVSKVNASSIPINQFTHGLHLQLLGCDLQQLKKALTHRTIEASLDVVTSPLNRELAIYARDALAKAIYDRLFTWIVERLNNSLETKDEKKTTVIGILDIYGFEIFQKNR